MSIEFRCTNVAGYDDSSQSYLVCNQKLRVNADRAGSTISCPKCNQQLEVPLPDLAIPDSESDFQSPGLSDLAQHQPGVMELDFSPATQSSAAFTKARKRCSECGGNYNANGICDSCGYAEPLQQAEKRAAANVPIKPGGFQLWLSKIANEGVSISIIGYVLYGVTAFFCVLTVLWGVLSTSFPGIIAAVLAAFLLCFSTAAMLKTRELATDRHADLGILAPLWNLLLVLARMLSWEKYDGKLSNRKILDLRNQAIDDESLRQQPGFQSCEVLDLENCDITDVGIRSLFALKSLQCVVLKNTKVSRPAIFKLQQHKPHLWIWW